MSMTLEELFAQVRSGEVELWLEKSPDPDEIRQRMKDPTFTSTVQRIAIQIHIEHASDKEKNSELFQVFTNHMNDIYLALVKSESSVCMLPAKHWSSYQQIEEEGEIYHRCDTCATDREQMIIEYIALPAAPAPILDFQAHQRKKQEN